MDGHACWLLSPSGRVVSRKADGVAAIGGTAVIATAGNDIGAGIGGLMLLGGSVLFLGPGIPLTVVGGRDVPARTAAAAVPVVHVGPGSLELRGRF